MGGAVARRQVLKVLVTFVGALAVTAGCGVDLTAPRLVVDVVPEGVAIDIVSRDEPVPSGETLLSVRNQSDREVRILLLKDAPPVSEIPAEVLRAVSPLESDYVIAASNPLKKRKNELAAGGIGYKVYATSFHVHLAKGHHYSIIAVAEGRVDGLVLESGAPT